MPYPTLQRRGFILPSRINASAYEGAGNGRRSLGWQTSSAGPTSASLAGLQTLRNRSRDAVRNNPWAAAVIDRLASNEIGAGIVPKSLHNDETIRAAIHELWGYSVPEFDADGITDFNGLLFLAAQTRASAGECFVRMRTRLPVDGLAVPLQLQLLEPEFVPHDKNEVTKDGNVIRAGIEFNGIGKRVAYWMYRTHPQDALLHPGYNDLVRVPAEQVLHVYEPLRPGQLRGVPVLATVLQRMKSLENFDDAVLFRQEVSNLFAGFIRKPAPEERAVDPVTGQPIELDMDGFTPMVGLEPGTMQELLPGEEVQFSTPPDAGNSYESFMRQQLLAVAAGVGVPYEVLTGDLARVNDRVIRVVLVEFRRRIEIRQFAVFIHQFCRPVWQRWLNMAVASGSIALPGYQSRQREYQRVRWVPPGWQYINPVQDVQAQLAAIAGGITSRSESVLRTGYDAELIDAENAADNDRANRLGLSYGTKARTGQQ